MSQQPGTKKYWIGLQNGGIAIYNHQTGELNYAGHNVEKEPFVDIIGQAGLGNSMFDTNKRFWFDSWAKVFPYAMYYDLKKPYEAPKKYEFVSSLKLYNETGGFMQQSDGRIWVRGLQLFGYFNEKEDKFELISNKSVNDQGISYLTLTCLFEDRERNVWAGTSDNGLYRFNPSKQFFTNIPHYIPGTTVKGSGSPASFVQLANDDVLVSVWGDGHYRYDKNFNLLPLGINGIQKSNVTAIWNMYPSKKKDIIWMGAQPGILKYNQLKNIVTFYNPAALEKHTVRQIVEDGEGKVWLGMQSVGLYQWSPAKAVDSFAEGIIKIEAIPNDNINHLVLDKFNWLWVATGSHGLYAIDPVTGKQMLHLDSHTDAENHVIEDRVNCVLPINDSLVLIATPTAIYLHNRFTRSLKTICKPDALSGSIAAMLKDSSGYIWVSTSNALYRIGLFSNTIIQFDRSDGIKNDRFTLAASYTLRDGRMLFGNADEFIVFNPADLNLKEQVPAVKITDFKVLDKSLSIDSIMALKRLVLGYKDNSFTINFSTLYYSSDYPVQYKLEGLDKEWRNADKNKNAIYSYLPPGQYTLLLGTIDTEGKRSSKETRLDILIRPPFWQTWWFYTLVAIAFIIELYWLDRQRMLRKKTMQKVRTDISDGLHQEINEALNNINILTDIARLKSDREPQKVKEYLEQIHAKSHNMIIAMDDMLWSLNPANDSMHKTISRIKEYVDALMQRHNVSIEILIDKNIEGLQLSMKVRHEAFLLFKEGLRSLVDAGTHHCIVHLSMEKAKLLFTIEFTNAGCDVQQLTNLLQRRDLEIRLNALGAKLDVQIHKSRSMILLQLQLG
ncbi:MAG: hypothetical protein M3Y85_03580 [Bacteroidota bacterium]|nr:hypothetical protein [Bacteroidota bacterium]